MNFDLILIENKSIPEQYRLSQGRLERTIANLKAGKNLSERELVNLKLNRTESNFMAVIEDIHLIITRLDRLALAPELVRKGAGIIEKFDDKTPIALDCITSLYDELKDQLPLKLHGDLPVIRAINMYAADIESYLHEYQLYDTLKYLANQK